MEYKFENMFFQLGEVGIGLFSEIEYIQVFILVKYLFLENLVVRIQQKILSYIIRMFINIKNFNFMVIFYFFEYVYFF